MGVWGYGPREIVAEGVKESVVNDSFGNRVSVSGSAPQPYSFTGREWDEETGLYYYRSRYMDPQTGRFIGEDPIGGYGQSAYAYVDNSPLNFIDPDGYGPLKPLAFIAKLLRKGGAMTKAIGKPLYTERQIINKGRQMIKNRTKGGIQVCDQNRALARRSGKKMEPGGKLEHHPRHKTEPGYDPHFQTKSGLHIWYSIEAGAAYLTVAHHAQYAGPVWEGAAEVVDFFNPLSLPQDLIDIGGAIVDLPQSGVTGGGSYGVPTVNYY
ncbi:MAG: RHS repeat-associated core domain-containing protein [Armatimonadetes bacterium]|nr:RHS repeat-associated core domain-containing protein [Armatimonadota bacterium]